MSTDANPVATSTPKADSSDEKILRENFFGTSEIKHEIKGRKFKRTIFNGGTKENFNRSNQQPPNSPNYLEKRRLQAVEAMKIAEQRRHRLAQGEPIDDSLSESMANMSISSIEYLPDGRLKLSPKELAVRREKHRRIRQFMAEQRLRKKQQRLVRTMRGPTYKIKTHSWTPHSIFRRLYRLGIARNVFHNDKPKFEGEGEKEVYQGTGDDSDGSREFDSGIIRYTIEELRDMNPYGYYFM